MAARIAVITDAHANLPALEAALAAIRAEGCDAVFHTGDAIAIGPQPAECLALLLGTPGLRCLMGNHEKYLLDGLPDPRPAWLSDGEVEHHHWTHACLGAEVRQAIAGWPYVLELDIDGVQVVLLHYALDATGRDFRPTVRHPSASDLDDLFGGHPARFLLYGHDHRASVLAGRCQYVNPGSLGCYVTAVARYALVTFDAGQWRMEQRAVPYDDDGLYRAFEARRVPERAFLYQAFFGGRFAT